MSVEAIGMMVITCGFIWGGFLGFLTLAIRREREKQRTSEE